MDLWQSIYTHAQNCPQPYLLRMLYLCRGYKSPLNANILCFFELALDMDVPLRIKNDTQIALSRTDGRAVECTGLENRSTLPSSHFYQ